MKTTRIFFGLLICLFTLSTVYANVTGYWYNPRLDDGIRVKDKGNTILIKGLLRGNDTQVFRHHRRNEYRDRRGNTILLEDHNTILYKNSRHRSYTRYERIYDHHEGRRRCHIDHDDFDDRWHDEYDYDHDDSDRDEDYWRSHKPSNRRDDYYDPYEDNNGRRDDYRKKSNAAHFELKQAVGTWSSDFDDRSVVIIDTRDGFKSKFSGTTKWVEYEQVGNKGQYKDNKGNTYYFESDSQAVWQSADKKRTISLRKVSNEVKY